MKKKISLFIFIAFLSVFKFFAESYFIGTDISNLRIEQNFENKNEVFYKKNNQLFVLKNEKELLLYNTKNEILEFEVYNNFYSKLVFVREKNKLNTYYESVLVISEDEENLIQSVILINQSKSLIDKISVSWNKNGFDLFWLYKQSLYRTSFRYDLNNYLTEFVAEKVVNFDCNDFNSEGWLYKENSLILFEITDGVFNSYAKLENVDKYKNISFSDKCKIFLIQKENTVYLYKYEKELNEFQEIVLVNDGYNYDLLDFQVYLDPLYAKCYLITFVKNSETYIQLLKEDKKVECTIDNSHVINILPSSSNQLCVSSISVNGLLIVYTCDFENLKVTQLYQNSESKINCLVGLVFDNTFIKHFYSSSDGLHVNKFSNSKLFDSSEVKLDDIGFLESIKNTKVLLFNSKIITNDKNYLYIYNLDTQFLEKYPAEQIYYSKILNNLMSVVIYNNQSLDIINIEF